MPDITWRADSKWGRRMITRHILLSSLVLTVMWSACVAQTIGKSAYACYGNVNQYLRLDCPENEVITVTKVRVGVKPKEKNCTSPANKDTYNSNCCIMDTKNDCVDEVVEPSKLKCEGQPGCYLEAGWRNLYGKCDQFKYPAESTYMFMDYTCIVPVTKDSTTSTSTSALTTTTLTSALTTTTTTLTLERTFLLKSTPPISVYTTTANTSALTTTDITSTTNLTSNATSGSTQNLTMTSKGLTQKHISTPSSDELSDVMIGAIVGGSLGMMFTLVVFMLYWGRKRQLRIQGRPQQTVWDYLLSQTFTVRGTRGYDHFSSIRSSASSDGETNSPVTRKNMWLPNIVHKDNNQPEDAISNYDNDTDRAHRVEIHPHADPAPYAFLNLYIDPTNVTHHEA